MNSKSIRTIAKAIIAEQASVNTNDGGQGCAGPGMIDSGTLAELVESGEIDDYEVVDGREAEEVVAATLAAHQHAEDDGTQWVVVRRIADAGGGNPYRHYLLLWEADEVPGVEDLYLYDSTSQDMLSADDLGITPEEYTAACRRSMDAAPEGHIYVGGRRVYAAE